MALSIICHVELTATDLERAKAFYGGMFGWTSRYLWDEYLMFETPENSPNFGFVKSTDLHVTERPSVYVQVDNIDFYLEKAKELGGDILQSKNENPEGGWFAVFKDPFGNPIGLFEE